MQTQTYKAKSSGLHCLTPRPPLGWNSFDCFGCVANERRLLDNLKVFVDRLKPSGYEYFVLDAGWQHSYELRGREFPSRGESYKLTFDEFGRSIPAACFFPNGIKAIADVCHAAGVKFGIHMMRGIPRAAVEENTRVLGSSARAADIADVRSICDWCPDNYGVDMTKEGAQAYYNSVIDLLVEWGVDFIKYDDIVPHPAEVDAVLSAIDRSGSDIVLSLSPGDEHQPDGWGSYYQANMVRVTGDIWDNREDLARAFDRWGELQTHGNEMPSGCWLDQDMIPFGALSVWNQSPEPCVKGIFGGVGSKRSSLLTSAQKRTFMAMRALAASPLFMGGDLTDTDEESFSLISNPDMLACNQNGIIGEQVMNAGPISVWKTPHRLSPTAGWFGVFNRHPQETQEVTLDMEQLGISNAVAIHDIWSNRTLTEVQNGAPVTLAADDVLFARYSELMVTASSTFTS